MSDAGVEQLREQVATSCRILGNREVTRGSMGHVSVRIPGTNHVLIKAKGPEEEALEFATEHDIITIDMDGNVLEAPEGLQAPNETAMHLAVLRAQPEIQSVIHTHPFWVVALLGAGKELVPVYRAYDGGQAMRLLNAGVPVYRKSVTITNDELGTDFMATMQDKKACLLVGHGMTTAGGSVEEATLISLQLFELARMNFLCNSIGEAQPVPDLNDPVWGGRRARGGYRDRTGESSEWRYQKKLVERRK